VLTMHDVSFCAHPEWFTWRHGLRMRTLARLASRGADAIVTMSQFSAEEIDRHLRPRVEPQVIPLAVDYRHPPLPAAMAPRDGEARPARVLFVGTILQRRHLPLLLEAFARARTVVGELTLDVIGANRTHPHQDLPALAASLGVDSAVRILEYVDDATLAEAYRSSGIFAYLSSYEGFGLPPLEAMQAGLATLVLDTTVAREVYRDGAAFVPPDDVDQVAARLVTLARDDAARTALVARGRAVASSYSWDDTAARTWEVLVTAARARS
jgi:glycosyltransferase involved in cell wall biosynthesis